MHQNRRQASASLVRRKKATKKKAAKPKAVKNKEMILLASLENKQLPVQPASINRFYG